MNFQQLTSNIRSAGKRLRVAVVCPRDTATLEAMSAIESMGIAQTTGVDADMPAEAARQAVAMVRQGDADVLMKGLIGTDQLLHAVLDKQTGLLPPGAVLTHISAAEIPTYHKMLLFSDAAVIPYPTQEQRESQVAYMAQTCRALGTECPRIALIHCSEKPSPKFPFVDGYAEIIAHAESGLYGPCVVDGPLDVKSACSISALRAKGIQSALNGDADALIFPDIEAGNAFYKSMTLFAAARTAGMLVGTTAPVVVPSRGDSTEAKLNSVVLAVSSIDH